MLNGPVSIGARGGHGPIRYHVTGYDPGRRVEFAFEPSGGLQGTHVLSVVADGPSRSVVRHILEDLLDRAEAAVGTWPARPERWSPWARTLRLVLSSGARRPARPHDRRDAARAAGPTSRSSASCTR